MLPSNIYIICLFNSANRTLQPTLSFSFLNYLVTVFVVFYLIFHSKLLPPVFQFVSSSKANLLT